MERWSLARQAMSWPTFIATTKGGKSLAEESDFRQLTGNAPSGAATSLFVNFASLQASLAVGPGRHAGTAACSFNRHAHDQRRE